MINSISILGSTGSIGKQTITAAKSLGIAVRALAARSNVKLLEQQARLLNPEMVCVTDGDAAKSLKISLADTNIRVVSGESGLIDAATADCDAVVTAVSGAVGLKPTLAAIAEKKRICLANKETLVCAGEIVTRSAAESGAEIIPVDSEHSAIFQCLRGRDRSELKKILLTASGGPFLGKKRAELADVTPEQAVSHPNWNMGAKISVDSATMMNKGLEFVEAMHLFGVTPDEIEIIIHPQSVIHSMVELTDGAVIAQCGTPSMLLPIQYSLTYPERKPSETPPLDFTAISRLTFAKPDYAELPCLALMLCAARRGGNLPCAVNAANEIAVLRFLRGEIGYNDIYDCIFNVFSRIRYTERPSLDALLETDKEARGLAECI